MAKKVRVTQSQVDAARLLTEYARAEGAGASAAVRKIAEVEAVQGGVYRQGHDDDLRRLKNEDSPRFWLYLGGPMRMIRDFNFPAFDAARDQLLCSFYGVAEVFSPADNDRFHGFEGLGKSGNPEDLPAGVFSRRAALTQDMAWIGKFSDGMVVLPGWEASSGTRAEVALHQALSLPVWELGAYLAKGVNAVQVPEVVAASRAGVKVMLAGHEQPAQLLEPVVVTRQEELLPPPLRTEDMPEVVWTDAARRKVFGNLADPGAETDPVVVTMDELTAQLSEHMRNKPEGGGHPRVRKFESGADRDSDSHKIDPEGALSPLVVQRYAEFILAHSVRHDGTRREADNWLKGMPLTSYASSLQRHNLHFWLLHRNHPVREDGRPVDIESALCGILFNAMGYLHGLLTGQHD